ncbi:hypothetical protein BLOT_009933 [Blomia tropicalis]|nr:hypothetical protein BLOT_009933 [Blomia tropicalis]
MQKNSILERVPICIKSTVKEEEEDEELKEGLWLTFIEWVGFKLHINVTSHHFWLPNIKIKIKSQLEIEAAMSQIKFGFDVGV